MNRSPAAASGLSSGPPRRHADSARMDRGTSVGSQVDPGVASLLDPVEAGADPGTEGASCLLQPPPHEQSRTTAEPRISAAFSSSLTLLLPRLPPPVHNSIAICRYTACAVCGGWPIRSQKSHQPWQVAIRHALLGRSAHLARCLAGVTVSRSNGQGDRVREAILKWRT